MNQRRTLTQEAAGTGRALQVWIWVYDTTKRVCLVRHTRTTKNSFVYSKRPIQSGIPIYILFDVFLLFYCVLLNWPNQVLYFCIFSSFVYKELTQHHSRVQLIPTVFLTGMIFASLQETYWRKTTAVSYWLPVINTYVFLPRDWTLKTTVNSKICASL